MPHTLKFIPTTICAVVLLSLMSACDTKIPSVDSIRDSKLLDRRIKETPREKVIRECKQEAGRFRVNCTHCHTTEKAEGITADAPVLTKVGERAQIMRTSPTFGLNQDCSTCHQTKFELTRTAQKLFGPGGAKYGESLKALKIDK